MSGLMEMNSHHDTAHQIQVNEQGMENASVL